MKKFLPSGIAFRMVLLFAIVCFIGQANAQIVLNNAKTAFTVEESSFDGLKINNTLSTLKSFDVNTEEGTFSHFSAENYAYTLEEGLPKLPVMRKLISIPMGATVSVRVVSSVVKEYKLSDLGINNFIMPVQPSLSKSSKDPVKFVINKEAYKQNRFFGEEVASAEVIGIMRNTRVARIDISPVHYNPVAGVIRVYEQLEIEVNFNGADLAATQDLNAKTASPYFNRLAGAFANRLPVMATRDTLTKNPVTYVIVSPRMFEEALQPFIEWKTKKGFKVIEGYTDDPAVGSTTSSIKSYLQGLYEAGTPASPSPTFILFVGDVAQIPTFDVGEHVTDLNYCEYSNDYLPEVYYGRFSATNVDQLQPYIDKTLEYEQYLFPDASFLGEAVNIAGVDGSWAPVHANGAINYATTYYFNEAHGILSHTYLYPASGSSEAQIIQNVSDGVGYACYTAHGSSSGWADPSFSISDIPGLQNQSQYPLMVGNCCSTSTYETTCFGEEIVRAANKGAIGYIGGSNSTYWDEDYYWSVGYGSIVVNPTYEGRGLGANDCLFHDHGETFDKWYTTMDQIIFAGNLAVTESNSSRKLYYWQIYNLMGDPSLTAYMGIPSEMAVTYEALMPLASTEFTITAEPYAYVAISKEGVLHGAAVADETGVAVVQLDPITVPGNADVVVTAQNKQPYIGTVLVASPDGPYVILQSKAVNDQNGTNNGVIDYNENFGFNVTLKNVGNSDANNVTSTISTSCEYVSIKSNTEEWGTITSGETANKELAFEIETNEFVPDQFVAVFDVEITDGNETWASSFNMKLNAPVLSISNLSIDDSGSATPNNRIDPGETVIVTFPIENTGHSDLAGVFTYFFSDSEEVTIPENAYYTGVVNPGTPGTASFEVTVSETAEIGTVLNFFASTNADPYSGTKYFGLPAGLIIEDFETGDFSAFDWVNTSSSPWTISNTNYNTGSYGAASGNIPNSSTTELSIVMDVAVNDNITFARKVSSESGYDYLKFYIDNAEKESWSGNVSWGTVSYPVTPGTHTFKWVYTKDGSQTSGDDKAYIDDIIFPSGAAGGGSSTELTAHPFAYPNVPCEENPVRLFGFTTNAEGDVTYTWEPAELLNSGAIYNPVAVLSEPTEFTLTVTTGLASDSQVLSLNVNPEVSAPVITLEEEILHSSVAEGNRWYMNDILIEGATGQTYEPLISGYYYATVSVGSCESIPSNGIWVTVVATNDIETAEFNLYPNPFKDKINVSFNLNSNSPVRISLVNLLGQEVNVLYNTTSMPSGSHNLSLDAQGLKQGVYFLHFEAEHAVKLHKMVRFE